MSNFAGNLARLRRQKGLTQDDLARKLCISFQAVSKWETAQSMPDLEQLMRIADILGVGTDLLLGHTPVCRSETQYEQRYRTDEYYWGLKPSDMCYEVMRLKPPTRPWKVLDVGCGEGKNAVFFARNGYDVTAFDLASTGLEKAQRLADACRVDVHFFRADICDFRLSDHFDVIFCSGVLHYLPEELRGEILGNYQAHTPVGGLHALNVFVSKPYLPPAPDEESPHTLWSSGELHMLYRDWHFHHFEEKTFDCASSGVPHKHCMDVILAEKIV